MGNLITEEFINQSIELAKEIQTPKNKSGDDPFADKLGPILDFPESKHFLIRLMDVAFRSHNVDRISQYVLNLFNSTEAYKPLFSPTESILVRLFRIVGHKFPSVSIPLMLDQIQEVTSPVVFYTGSEKFKTHVAKRKKHGITLNINPIGETLIGEQEAKERLQKYIDVLNDPQVNYISVKLSTLHSQLIAIAHDEVVEECIERVSILFQEVLKIEQDTGLQKFVNLDMEEYRDLSITIETFMRTLDQPQFKTLRAGIVLQAYLPDTYQEAIKLRDWAIKRVQSGGSPVKVRIVKGANLEMEKTEASLHGWPLAPYSTKLETDTNYKKIIVELLQPNFVQCLNVGVASHNVFDLSFSLNLVLTHHLEDFVDFEMLEGMAKSTAIEMNKKGANLILYTPVVEKENYLNSIAYLVRRLDEGTQSGNFLKEGFNLVVNSERWNFLKNQFIESVKGIESVKTTSNRIQNRYNEQFHIQTQFKNVADTDWIRPVNRNWIKSTKVQWQQTPPLSIIPVIGMHNKTNRVIIQQQNWKGMLPWKYELAEQEDYEAAINAHTNWYEQSNFERAHLLKKAAYLMAERRAELIGVAVTELGKLPAEVDIEVSEAIDFANYYAHSISTIAQEGIPYEQTGINLVLSPWNFPIAIPIGGVLASLAAGKRVILKPSQNAAASAYLISKCLWDAGIPKEVFSFLPCKESCLDKYLTEGNLFDAVILTGGTETARFLLHRNPYLNLFAETGGKNATIVTALADREQAVKNVVSSAFGNAGQKCSATSLLILEKELFEDERFKTLLKDAAESKTFGHPWNLKSQIGPLAVPINEKLTHVLENTDDEQWLLKPILNSSFELSPGIKWGITNEDYEYKNELFGPILCVMEAHDLDHAIALANGTPFGLTSGLESLDKEEVNYWTNKIEAGNIYANRSTTGAIVERQPFGGIKASSYGFGMKAGGPNYVLQFLTLKNEFTEFETIKKSYALAYSQHFSKRIDYAKVRGQHNFCQYIMPKKVIIIVDNTTFEHDLKMVIQACETLCVEFEIISNNEKTHLNGYPIKTFKNLIGILQNHSQGTIIRSITKKVPELFLRACHNHHIHVYNRIPHPNGRIELLNYLTEQSISINYHRYGNLMGEGPSE